MNGKWSFNVNREDWNYNDGISAYSAEIKNSGKMHINRSTLSKLYSNPGKTWYSADGSIKFVNQLPGNPVWHSKGIIKNKWFYSLPKRF